MKTKEVHERLLDILTEHLGVVQSLEIANDIINQYKTDGQTTFYVKINPFQELAIKLKGDYNK